MISSFSSILLVITFVYYVSSLKPSEYCYVNEICKETDSNENFKRACQKSKCFSKNSYKCNQDLCAKDRLTCQQLYMWSILIGQMKDPIKIENQMKSFEFFSTQIQSCPEHEWKPSDVCINHTKCAYKPQIWSLSFLKVVFGECPCKGSHKYKCGNGYCAHDEKGCEGLFVKKIEKSTSVGLLLGIKKCY